MTSNSKAIKDIEIPGFPSPMRGKVRNIFECKDALLFVATDRISAFDVILPDPIPNKGIVLTALSGFWFEKTSPIVKNHFITSNYDEITTQIAAADKSGIQGKHLALQRQQLEGRSMLVTKCTPLPVECVVRGYLSGSGWKEYQYNRAVGGHHLPEGLVESCELPTPIFTPATKAQTGHDENIDFSKTVSLLGKSLAHRVRDLSLKLYQYARELAFQRGIIIADTKFEFGIPSDINLSEAVNLNKEVPVMLIDEALTPDSSRFWPADLYEPGRPQPSFDKQFVRDYLETLNWDKQPPAPTLPEEIIRKTTQKYLEALERITN